VQVFVSLDNNTGIAANLNANHQLKLPNVKCFEAIVMPSLYTLFEPLFDVHMVEIGGPNCSFYPFKEHNNTVNQCLDSFASVINKGLHKLITSGINVPNLGIPEGNTIELVNGQVVILDQWVLALQQFFLFTSGKGGKAMVATNVGGTSSQFNCMPIIICFLMMQPDDMHGCSQLHIMDGTGIELH
jgi:hypothetical protein